MDRKTRPQSKFGDARSEFICEGVRDQSKSKDRLVHDDQGKYLVHLISGNGYGLPRETVREYLANIFYQLFDCSARTASKLRRQALIEPASLASILLLDRKNGALDFHGNQ